MLPHLSQWFSNSSEEFKITFGNRGVGPAFIKKIHIVIGDSIEFDNTDDVFRLVFNNTKAIDSLPFSSNTFKKGYVLPANQRIDIITIKNKNARRFFQEFMRTNTLDYEVIYEDVYGTRWSLSNAKDENIPVLLTTED